MEKIEYKECRITITPASQGSGRWGAQYHVSTDRIGMPIQGLLEGEEPTPDEAIRRASRIVKVAINEAIPFTGEKFSASLSRLNERFAL